MATNSILLEVVNNALRSVAEQMTVTMVRSSYSTIVKEMMDCSSAIFDDKRDRHGRGVPQHAQPLRAHRPRRLHPYVLS